MTLITRAARVHAGWAHACLAIRDDLTMALGGDLKLTTFGLTRPQRRAWPYLGCDRDCVHKVCTSLSASTSGGSGCVVCIGHRQLDGHRARCLHTTHSGEPSRECVRRLARSVGPTNVRKHVTWFPQMTRGDKTRTSTVRFNELYARSLGFRYSGLSTRSPPARADTSPPAGGRSR